MKHLTITGFIALTILGVSSCQKNDTTTVMPSVTPSATITIASPTADQTFNYGDIMQIEATIEGNVKMHGYHVVIINTANGDTVFHAEDHTHALSLKVDQKWECTVNSPSDIKLYISSALNHDGLEVVKTVTFKTAH